MLKQFAKTIKIIFSKVVYCNFEYKIYLQFQIKFDKIYVEFN